MMENREQREMNRRRFLVTAGVMAGATAFGKSFPILGRQYAAVEEGSEYHYWSRTDHILLPRGLRRGDTVAIVAPASGVAYRDLRQGIQKLQQMGLKVELGKYLYPEYKYLAAPDEDRAEELMHFAQREDVRAIIAARGGYGVMRIFPYLDFSIFRENPKIYIGYSDITALLLAIYQKSGIVTFHGPVASSTFDTFTTHWFHSVLFASDEYASIAPENWEPIVLHPQGEVWTISSGKASGKLVGGNLTLLVSTLGTPYEIDTTDAILFIEEIAEEPYKVDRMLMQLKLAGKFDQCRGIALGQFVNCEQSPSSPFPASFTLREVFLHYFESLDIPVVYGLPIGHIQSKWTLPIGVLASLDADHGEIALLEPVVTP